MDEKKTQEVYLDEAGPSEEMGVLQDEEDEEGDEDVQDHT